MGDDLAGKRNSFSQLYRFDLRSRILDFFMVRRFVGSILRIFSAYEHYPRIFSSIDIDIDTIDCRDLCELLDSSILIFQ